MAGKQIENLVAKIVQDILSESNLELVDVEYAKERDWHLRVFLDKPGGLEIDDCQWVSERLEDRLDETDPIRDSYILEVSSPGLDRPLKKPEDFARHIGEVVEIHTFAPFNGQKMLVGKLLNLEDDAIKVEIDGTEMNIPRDKTAQVKLHIDF